MLIITCPWCGPRDQTEFAYGGEAHIVRPKEPDALTDSEWGDYLFMRKNRRGRHLEQWGHAFGCRRWFNVERDTVSYAIKGSYQPGEAPPEISPSPGSGPPEISLPPGGGPGRGST